MSGPLKRLRHALRVSVDTMKDQFVTDSHCELCEAHAPKDDAGKLTGPLDHLPDCAVSICESALQSVGGSPTPGEGRPRFIRILELSPVQFRATWWVAGQSYGAIVGAASDLESAVRILFRKTEEVRDGGVMDKIVDPDRGEP